MAVRESVFTTIRCEGMLLPIDLLRKVIAGGVDGVNPTDYHLDEGTKLNEAVSSSWNRILGFWQAFSAHRAALPKDDPGTTITRERWLLPLFQELGYGRLERSAATAIGEKEYPISHMWRKTPIHLLGCGVSIDKRSAGVTGAARMTPHGMVQEFLNRSEGHLWAFLSNGLRLRILRDNNTLTRQSYVEFDLEAMMEGKVFADFALLWLVCHQSRVESDRPEQCWLERWMTTANEQGIRALDALRGGVEQAIAALGRGFLAHPANNALRDKLRRGVLDKQAYYHQLLRTVYRLIFLFAAEDRELLHSPVPEDASAAAKAAVIAARERYDLHYSTTALRAMARRRRGTRHHDLWRMLALVFGKLGDPKGCPELALPVLGSFLWSGRATPDLADCELANVDLLAAIRALNQVRDGKVTRLIDYRNIGAEEWGGIFESLLELRPNIDTDPPLFELKILAGNERKTTGSYYTPLSLISTLLDSALEPVVNEALARAAETTARKPPAERLAVAEKAILELKVCDPACGSGHFLVAAAHRLGKRLAAVRAGEEEPSPEAYRTALRDVIGRCIYGVDINPMAVELCKINLWMEAIAPGKPLSFLDAHIQKGNSLLGTTPALMAAGIPDEAFVAIEGDDKPTVSALKKHNKQARVTGQMSLLSTLDEVVTTNLLAVNQQCDALAAVDDSTIGGVQQRERIYSELLASTEYRHQRMVADAWCAAFVWPKRPDAPTAITQDIFRQLQEAPDSVSPAIFAELDRITRQYEFVHWHLVFADVFRLPREGEMPTNQATGWRGGFDVVLGNPPWERVKIQEKEWFAERNPDIANAQNAAARKRLIAALVASNPGLHRQFLEDSRKAEGESHLLRNSGRYPLCGRGDINTYAVFAEDMRTILNARGRTGCIMPTGIATDDTTKYFFQNLVNTGSLASLYDFENRKGIFPAIDSRMKFCLLTIGNGARPISRRAELIFFAHSVDDLHDPDRRFSLTGDEIAKLNPNTRTCPIFRSRRDAELTKAIYRRVPVFIRDAHEDRPEINYWDIKFVTMFHMANDSHLFRTSEQLLDNGWHRDGNRFNNEGEMYLPLYEAKMFHHYDHRWATYEHGNTRDVSAAEIKQSTFMSTPRYWVASTDVESKVIECWKFKWFLGWRDITNITNERTVISSILPWVGANHKIPLYISPLGHLLFMLHANCSSISLDYIARQKVGGTSLTYFYHKQLPIFPPERYNCEANWDKTTSVSAWLFLRVLELTFTAWDLEPFARDCGFDGPPFHWNENRRFLLRAELDAAFFHLYLPADVNGDWQQAENETPEELARLKAAFATPRAAVDYIMDTFPIVKRKDEEKYNGDYRTKRVILEIYDAMATAIRTGQPYLTRLNPPPADRALCHPGRA